MELITRFFVGLVVFIISLNIAYWTARVVVFKKPERQSVSVMVVTGLVLWAFFGTVIAMMVMIGGWAMTWPR